jgi:hypothetical protein
MPVHDIAEKIRGENKINARKCEQRCSYQLAELEANAVVESFMSGRRKLYKLKEGVEVLDGAIALIDTNGEIKYTENINKVLRMTTDDGETYLSILQ